MLIDLVALIAFIAICKQGGIVAAVLWLGLFLSIAMTVKYLKARRV